MSPSPLTSCIGSEEEVGGDVEGSEKEDWGRDDEPNDEGEKEEKGWLEVSKEGDWPNDETKLGVAVGGGGLVGTFNSQAEALQHLEDEGLKVEDYDINRTQTHTLLKVDEKTGDISDIPFLFDCSISKLKVSREWNTQIAKLGGDRFSSLWKMSSVQTANKAGQRFMNISVSNVGWLKEETYEVAKGFYNKTFAKS